MLDSSKLETGREIAERVPQGAEGDRRDPFGAASSSGVPDPELAERPRRRRFTAEYKLRVLREAEACTRKGEIGAMLRREGLYTSHLTAWRKQRDAGALVGLAPRKRGPRGPSPEQVENEALRRRLERTQSELETARRVIEVQGNVSALLEDLLAPKSATETDAVPPRR
jgi:transposase-like protein